MELFSVLLQEGPAETTNYMVMGYTLIFAVLFLYLISLYLRKRNLERDQELLLEIEAHEMESVDKSSQPAASTLSNAG